MYTYTPQENIEQARLRIGDISLQDYINSANAIIQSSNTNRVEEQSSSPNYSTAQVVGDTLGMVAKDVFNGLSKAFEGIVDFGAGLVGSIAKWAGNESVEQAMADYVARDTTNEYVWNGLFKGTNQDFEASAINKMSETGQNIVRGVAQGVGGMIPTIAISLISRGAGASAGAASIASLTQMGISAAGTATEEALNDEVYDANGNRVKVQLDRAFLYGLASGCMEIATETIIGGAYEGIFGKGLLDGVVKNLTKNVKFGKLIGWLVNNLGEGVEEIVSAVFEDTLKTIYNSPDGKMHWKAPELQNVIESGIIGSLTSVVMGTSSQVLSRVSSKNTIGQSLQNISENNEWASNLQEKGRYDEKRAASVSQDNEKQLNTIEKRLKIMSDVKRARIMTQMPQLFNYFNNDGTRIAKQQLESGVSLAENIEVGRQNGTYDARITDDNKVSNTLAKAETRLEGKEHLSIATDVDTDEQKNNLKVVKKLTDPIGRASGVPLKIVVFQSDVKDSQVNGFISGDTMYVNKDKLNNLSDIAKVWSHESLGHFTENTKEHSILIGQLKGAYEEMYNEIEDYIKNRSNYQESEYKSETEAHFIEAVFGGLDIIDENGKQVHLEADITNDLRDRIIAENSGAFKKLANRIKWIVEKLKATFTGDKKTLEYIERLDNIAKTIDSALAKGGTKVIADKVEKATDIILEKSKKLGKKYAQLKQAVEDYCKENNIELDDPKVRELVPEAQFSIAFASDIAQEQLTYNKAKQILDINDLNKAIENEQEMAELMAQYEDILPYDEKDFAKLKKHKVLKGNASYGKSVENTTICVRTLAYNQFVDQIQKKLGRPMTQSESFLASQMLYKIAKEPQCLYCYVSLDRKAYNEFLKRYIDNDNNGRDAIINQYKQMSKEEKERAKNVPTADDFAMTKAKYEEAVKVNPLYAQFIFGKKNTKDMRRRYNFWLSLADSNAELITLQDLATKERMGEIEKGNNTSLKQQLKDARAYAQSASWAKKQEDYISYYNEIRKMSQQTIDKLNQEFGLRFYSFSDYTPAFILENMQEITDASLRGLRGLSYTKDLDYVKVFAKTGMNINVSVFVRYDPLTKRYYIDGRQSAVGEGNVKHPDLQELLDLRKKYKNVGVVAVATDNEGVMWAMDQEWTDVVIPFHIVRTGDDIATNYGWTNYKNHQGEKVVNSKQFEDWITHNENKSAEIFPPEHQNDKETYLRLVKEKGVRAKFEDIPELFNHPNYMKLVVETRQSVNESQPLKPIFDIDEAKKSFQYFADNGGYFDGYYFSDVNVDESVQQVVDDVEAIERGEKTWDDISYRYKDMTFKELQEMSKKMRKLHRGHQSAITPKQDDTQFSFSNQTDSNGNLLTNGQVEYFEKSKVRNDDGKLQVLYHGTNGNFTIFDKALSQNAFFFSNDHNVAHSYGDTIMPIYLNIEKPYIIDAYGSNWDEIFDYNRDIIKKWDIINTYVAEHYPELKKWANPTAFPQDVIDKIEETFKWKIKPLSEYDEDTRLGAEELAEGMSDEYRQVTFNYVVDESEVNSDETINYWFCEGLSDFLWTIRNDDRIFKTENTRQLVNRIRRMVRENKGDYDGIIIKNLYDMGGGFDYIKSNIYIAFNPNQIKLTTNENPTEDDDIRFSLKTNSDGQYLTEKQVEYFKDTKVKDENGNLLVVYHGTDSNFTIFDKELSQNAFFFTNKPKTAYSYGKKLMPVYLNIKKPYVIDAGASSWNNIYDEKKMDYSDDISELKKYYYDNAKKIDGHEFPVEARQIVKKHLGFNIKPIAEMTQKEINDWGLLWYKDDLGYLAYKNDSDRFITLGIEDFIDRWEAKEIYSSETTREIVARVLKYKEQKKIKCDGIIIKNLYDMGKYKNDVEWSDIYIVFESNQIKSISNLNPSESDDIRFSLNPKERLEVIKTKDDIKQVVQSLFMDDDSGNPIVTYIAEEDNSEITRKILREAPYVPENMVETFADEIAKNIIEKATYDKYYEDDIDIQQLKQYKKNAARYRHKIRFSDSDKAELIHRYDRKGAANVLRAYSKKDGGYYLDQLIQDMYEEIGIQMPENESTIDLFFDWIHEVDNISSQIDRATSEHRGQYTIDSLRLPYEKVEMIKEQIRERLVSVLEPYVANHQIERDNILEEERERLKAEYDKKVKADEMKLADAKKQMEEELAKRKIELDKQREQEVDNQVLQQTKKVVMEANRMVNESEKNLDKIKKENAEMKKRFKLLRKVTNKARWFRKENMKEFNKSSLQDEGIEQAVSGLSKIGNVNYAGGKGARQVVADYIEKFYNPEHREMIGEQFQDDLYDDLKAIADNRFRTTKTGKTFRNNKDLTLNEIEAIQNMLLNAQNIVEHYHQIKINGKYENIDNETKKSLETMKKFAPMLSDAKVIRAMRQLMANAIEPRVVIKMLFGMQDNILSDLYEDIARGETKGKALQLHLDQMLQSFYKEHKKYGKTLSKIVMFRGQKMTKAQLLTLVKYYEQDHSNGAVLNTGWAITNEKTGLTEKVSGFIDGSKLLTQKEIENLDADALEELKEKRKEDQELQAAKEMYDLLTEEDQQYLEKISDIMEEAAKMQIQTDIEFKGYSDINPETARKYLPIKRYGGDFAVDSFKAVLDSMKVDQAGNQSISKARTRNQRHLQLFDIDTLVLNYARQLGVYYGLAVPIKEFQRAYNFNVTDNVNKPISIRNTISEDVWDYAGKYITKLLGDIQGFDRGTSAGTRFLSKIRSGYVTASLGLNIKVMLTQFASYPTAFSILRASSLAKAFTKKISFKEMDKYSDYANVRNALDDAAKSQGADGGFNGKLGNLAKASMWGIGRIDRLTIGLVWNACQFEVQAKHKGDAEYKFGTDKNKEEAAILLEDVGRMTQPNYTTTERTGIQRSNSEIVRWTLGSFTSVPSKMLSRLVETSMELRALWYRQHKLGENVSAEEKRAIGTKFVKSVTAVTMSNLMYVLIAQALKFAFDKDRKDKEGNEIDWWEDMLIDFGSVNVGMIPFFKDLYSSFVQGYSYDGSTFSTGIISDLFAIGEDAIDMVTKSANGKATSTNTIMGWIKKMAVAVSTLMGIPTRNVYNQLYGIVKRFDPSAAYEMNSIFYSTSNYSKDLRKAIEDGDTDLANTIMGLMLKEKGISRISDKATDKIRELYAKGYNILPRTIGDSVTIDGEEYGLSATQQQKIKSVYDQANSEVEKLIADNGFNRLDEKIQAKTIKWIYDYYYEYAVANTLGLTADSKKLLYGETMSVSRFALAISVCSAIAPDKDRKGNNIAGTKKDKIIRTLRNVGMTRAEREMILAYLGYSVDESIISRYIRSLGLTRNQQTIFKSYMSFAA